MSAPSHRRGYRGWLILAVANALVSCSSPPQPVPGPPVVWPAPPAKARIQHVANVTRPADLGATTRGPAGWFAKLTGSEKTTEKFLRPFALSLDEDQNLVIVDSGANQVGYLDLANRRWQRWNAVGGKPFRSPVAAVKRNGLIYVADSAAGEVVVFNLKGAVKQRLTEKLVRPCGLAFQGEDLLVVDSQRHAVIAFGPDGRIAGELGARGGGPGQFNFPTHLATDAQGRLYVSDSMNKRIQVFDARGNFLRQVGSGGDSPGHFGCPKGVAVDAEGRIFALDAVYDCLQIFDPDGRLLLNLGQTGADPGEFWLPNGIAVSRDNRIYIADAHNRRIQVLSQVEQP